MEDVEEDVPPSVPFEGVVRRSNNLEPGSTVLILASYTGDIEVGDLITAKLGDTAATATVSTIAWGSSFRDEAPPLTLVVKGLEGTADWAGAQLNGTTRR